MKIKICGLCSDDDVRSVNLLLPDFAGFIFYEASPRSAMKLDSAVVNEMTADVQRTGVFVNAGKDFILRQRDAFGLQVVQLHGDESPAFCEALKKEFCSVIKSFRVTERFDFNSQAADYAQCCNYFLFDSAGKYHGGNGTKFRWQRLETYSLTVPFFLSGGIGPGDVQEIRDFRHEQLAGCDINSCFEKQPGQKNIPLIQEFIHQLKKSNHVSSHF